jgi:hypothetical protein
VTVDDNGNVYVVDSGHNRVVKDTLSGGTYSQSVITSSALSNPYGVVVDGAGDVYISDPGNHRLVGESYANAPSLSFATTTVGATSADSPQSVTLLNFGNAALSITTPGTGTNPGFASGSYSLNAATTCPEVSASSLPGVLAADASCVLAINFTPTTVGANPDSLTVLDNSLNSNAMQAVTVSGNGVSGAPQIPVITWATPAPITAGTALSATQLDATASVAGTFAYSPASGTTPASGMDTLSVTFTPTDTTNYTTASATVTLAVQDFSLGGGSGSSSQTVTAGGTATFMFALAPVGSATFPLAVTFSVSGLPAGATATFMPGSVAAGSAGTTFSMLVHTSGGTVGWTPGPPGLAPFAPAAVRAMLLCVTLLSLLALRKRRRFAIAAMPVILLATLALGVSAGLGGCSSGSSGGGTSSPLVVTATSGALQHSFNVTLIVKK